MIFRGFGNYYLLYRPALSGPCLSCLDITGLPNFVTVGANGRTIFRRISIIGRKWAHNVEDISKHPKRQGYRKMAA